MAEKKKSKGRGWHGDPDGHARAGREGGRATAASHGEEFYEEIGQKGGRARSVNRGFNNDRSGQEMTE